MAVAIPALLGPMALQAQKPSDSGSPAPLELSVSDALTRALTESPDVRNAQAAVDYAAAESRSARASALPQLNAQLAYSRALRSVFQGVSTAIPDSLKFNPDPNASLTNRVKYLEDNSGLAALGALTNLFSEMPFGRANTWTVGLSVTQPIFTGGRIRSAIAMAGDAADAARFSLNETRSDIALQVKTGYYDAELADRSAAIMEQSVELAQAHLREVKLRYGAGDASELDTLRAAVDLANLLPQLLTARNARDLTLLNLKRLIRLPADAPLRLTTQLTPLTRGGTPILAVQLPPDAEVSALLERRGAVRAAQKAIDIGHAQVGVARSAFLPTVAFTGALNRQAYPSALRFPAGADWRDDWNIGFAVQWPLFQGLKRSADLDAAHAQLRQAEVQAEQLHDGVRIQYRQAAGEFERAKAQINAAARTAAQAKKVYDLTELRFGEGLATQLDVSSARLALQQARINEVQAYHDAYAALALAERELGIAPERTTLP